ncbi:Transcriptional regulator, TetR family [Chitinispirillum alkaliphilum]|nr:Transcriptional regulator, TetR family [Chitinispirillum alkaliphilum]
MSTDIKETLWNEGLELFRCQGFKKTSIAQITERCGIAVGSFYKYYPSKENLFLDIYFKMNLSMEEQVMESCGSDENLTIYVKNVILSLLKGIKSDPILREWYDRESWHKIISKCDFKSLDISSNSFSYSLFLSIIKKWKENGRIRQDLSEELILAMFDSLFIIDLYSKDIGEHFFPDLIIKLTEFIVQGLNPGRGVNG